MPRRTAELTPLHRPTRVAVIGCGVMGRRHVEVVLRDPGAVLVAAVDPVVERAEAMAARGGGATRLPEPGDVDVAIIATDTRSHVEVTLPLLEAGVWCLVEKPVAASVAEAEALTHPRCLVGHCERFNPAVRAAAVVSPVELVMQRIGPWTGRSADIDVIADLMVHDLDLALGWSPKLDCVGAEGERGPSGRLDRVRATLAGPGIRVDLIADRMATDRRRVVAGRDAGGALYLDLAQGLASREGVALQPVDGLDALSAQWAAVQQRLRGNRSTVAELEAAQAALRLAESVRRRVGA